jgi:hypothetical protein
MIGIVAIVALFLYAVTHNNNSGPAVSTAAPTSRPAPTPAYVQAQPVEVRRALPIDVRRALPVVPRAELVGASGRVASPWNSEIGVGDWHDVTLLDGTTKVNACYQGWLPSSSDLPNQGHFIGEEFATGDVAHPDTWIWLTPTGAHFASWVDP